MQAPTTLPDTARRLRDHAASSAATAERAARTVIAPAADLRGRIAHYLPFQVPHLSPQAIRLVVVILVAGVVWASMAAFAVRLIVAALLGPGVDAVSLPDTWPGAG